LSGESEGRERSKGIARKERKDEEVVGFELVVPINRRYSLKKLMGKKFVL